MWDAVGVATGELAKLAIARPDVRDDVPYVETTNTLSDNEMTERRRAYHVYLQTGKWKRLRREVFARAGGFCERCGILQAVHCHHLTYARFKDELLTDLQAVCQLCHEKIHGKLIPERRAAPKVPRQLRPRRRKERSNQPRILGPKLTRRQRKQLRHEHAEQKAEQRIAAHRDEILARLAEKAKAMRCKAKSRYVAPQTPASQKVKVRATSSAAP